MHWQPQIYVDAHEMGYNATYFFSPKAGPPNPFNLPTLRGGEAAITALQVRRLVVATGSAARDRGRLRPPRP